MNRVIIWENVFLLVYFGKLAGHETVWYVCDQNVCVNAETFQLKADKKRTQTCRTEKLDITSVKSSVSCNNCVRELIFWPLGSDF